MLAEKVKFEGVEYDSTHGSPFDRGSADSWYSRPEEPHWYPEGTYRGKRVTAEEMSLLELAAYYAGYRYNEKHGGKKEWD